MSVEHRTDRPWIQYHLSHALGDRPCVLTVVSGGEALLLRSRWPMLDGAQLPLGTKVHLRYRSEGRTCGFFSRVVASTRESVLLDDPDELTVVLKKAA